MTESHPSSLPPTLSFAPVTKDQIAAFADKLAHSGASLPPAERVLLQVLVDKARAIAPEDVRMEQLREGITEALRSVAEAQARAWGADRQEGWVRIDPIWVKSDASEPGHTVEVVAKVVTR